MASTDRVLCRSTQGDTATQALRVCTVKMSFVVLERPYPFPSTVFATLDRRARSRKAISAELRTKIQWIEASSIGRSAVYLLYLWYLQCPFSLHNNVPNFYLYLHSIKKVSQYERHVMLAHTSHNSPIEFHISLLSNSVR